MNPRVWVPVAAWWFRVWVTVRGTAACGDPLETAVAELVGAGCDTEAAVGRALALPSALTSAAVAALVSSGVLVVDKVGKLGVGAAATDGRAVHARRGWVAWEARHGRPLRQIWLDDEIPDASTLLPPNGWEVCAPQEESRPNAGSPHPRDVDAALRLLPAVGGLVLAEQGGAHARFLEGEAVARLRRAADVGARRGFIWVPVEQRVSGAVIWLPGIIPHADLVSELDPGGVEQLANTSPEGRTSIGLRAASLRDAIAPGVLTKAGFETVEALREASRREAEHEVGVAFRAAGDGLRQAIVEAYVGEVLARVLGGDGRGHARGWADVLELATGQLIPHLRHVLRAAENPGNLSPEREREVARTLGPSWPHVKKLLSKPDECRRLREACDGQVHTIGTRVLALGVAVVIDRTAREAFMSATRDTPQMMKWLEQAVQERNLIVHPKPGEVVDAAGFRSRTVAIVAGLMRFGEAMGAGA